MIRLVHRSYYQLSKITAKMILSSRLDQIGKIGDVKEKNGGRFGEFEYTRVVGSILGCYYLYS
jgi:hypothetical protein